MPKAKIAWDTETFRFGPGNMAPPIVVSSWCTPTEGPDLIPAWWPTHWPVIRGWLNRAAAGELLIVGQNVAYDFACLMSDVPEAVPYVFAAYDADGVADTMLDQKLIDIAAGQHRGWTSATDGTWNRNGYSLADIVRRWLGINMDKDVDVRTNFGDLWGIEPDQWPERSRTYAMDDARLTLHAHLAQERHDAERGGLILVDRFRQARAALALHLIEAWGIRTDREGVQRLHDEAAEEVGRIKDELIAGGLVRAKNSSRDMKAIYARFEEVWPGCPRTPKGKPKTDAEACEESGDPLLQKLSDYNKAQNVLTKDCKELAQGTVVPLHTRYDPILDTGRTSSSGPNIQNVKRRPGVRECFVPRLGMLFCSCDYAQLELYTLAQVQLAIFGRSSLADALRAGLDPHLLVAAQVLRIPYEEALANRRTDEVSTARQHAKPVNFGLSGGMGVKGLLAYAKGTYGIAFTGEQAEDLIGHYHETWPDMREYFDWIRELVGPGGSTTITQILSGRVRGHVKYTVACNGFFQALAADGAKAAMYEVAKLEYVHPGHLQALIDRGARPPALLSRTGALYGCRTVNFVHDELIVEVPDDPEEAHAAAMDLKSTMEEAFRPWCPDLPVRAEPALMRRWSKKAEAVYDNRGMLIPWEEPIR